MVVARLCVSLRRKERNGAKQMSALEETCRMHWEALKVFQASNPKRYDLYEYYNHLNPEFLLSIAKEYMSQVRRLEPTQPPYDRRRRSLLLRLRLLLLLLLLSLPSCFCLSLPRALRRLRVLIAYLRWISTCILLVWCHRSSAAVTRWTCGRPWCRRRCSCWSA
jgi:hypothetical protein